MVSKKAAPAGSASLEIDSLFEQELRVQNEDLRKAAALRTFYKLHPSNRVSVDQFIISIKQNKDIWSAVSGLGILDFAEAVLGSRSATSKPGRAEAKSGKRTRLSEGQKNALKSSIVAVLGGHKDGLNRNDIAKAIPAEQLSAATLERAELANKLRQPLAELVGDGKIHTVGEKRLMKYLAGPSPRKK